MTSRPPGAALVVNVADERGRGMVRRLIARGLDVAVHFRGDHVAINVLVEEVWDGGGRIVAFDDDGDPGAGPDSILREARARLGPIDVVIDGSLDPDARDVGLAP